MTSTRGGGMKNGNRSKRIKNGHHLKVATHSVNRLSWSSRRSSFSWAFIYARTICSSNPTVETKYPLAQKCCPVKFFLFPRYTRAIWIALFPLRNPTTCETEYLGGIEISICTWSGFRCPSRIWHSFCDARSLKLGPRYFLSPPYSSFFRYLGIHTKWYLHSHLVWLKLCLLSNESLLVPELWAVHNWEAFSFPQICQFPEMSNSGSPPAEPGVYLNEITGGQLRCQSIKIPHFGQ